jgi:hypothetical protein
MRMFDVKLSNGNTIPIIAGTGSDAKKKATRVFSEQGFPEIHAISAIQKFDTF